MSDKMPDRMSNYMSDRMSWWGSLEESNSHDIYWKESPLKSMPLK
jgi:hypothetical protein